MKNFILALVIILCLYKSIHIQQPKMDGTHVKLEREFNGEK